VVASHDNATDALLGLAVRLAGAAVGVQFGAPETSTESRELHFPLAGCNHVVVRSSRPKRLCRRSCKSLYRW